MGLVSIGRPRDARQADASVVLLNPPTITARYSLSYYGAVPPLGLAYLAGAVERAGHPLKVIDATGEALFSVLERATEVGPLAVQGLTIPQIIGRLPADVNVVGIGHMFLHQWPYLRELAAAIRAARPRATIVLGGENATSFWEFILKDSPHVDVCVLGEGEETFLALLEALRRGDDLATVPGLAYRDRSNTPVANERRQRIAAVDELAAPAWDHFPVDAYLQAHQSGGVDRGRSMPLLTSRGCPYRCSFCSSPQMWTTRYIRRTPTLVVDEIQGYVERYGITNVDINDLTAMLTKEWIVDFCKELAGRDLGVTLQFPSGTRSEAVDAEAAEWMYKAGVRNFCYAPESGSARTLEAIHKKVQLPRLKQSLDAAIGAGLTTHASIIIGFPHEDVRDMWATYRFVLSLALAGLDTVAVMTFSPYPGSEEYDRLVSRGALEVEERYFYTALLRSAGAKANVHPQLTGDQLGVVQMAFLLSFYGLSYLRYPKRVVGLLRRLVRGEQSSVMDQFLQTKLAQFRIPKLRSAGGEA